jgi:hypothetical protein
MDVTLNIDKFGHVLLPERLRQALHAGPGDKVHARLDGEQLTDMSEPRAAMVYMKNSFLLIEFADGLYFMGGLLDKARAKSDVSVLNSHAN